MKKTLKAKSTCCVVLDDQGWQVSTPSFVLWTKHSNLCETELPHHSMLSSFDNGYYLLLSKVLMVNWRQYSLVCAWILYLSESLFCHFKADTSHAKLSQNLLFSSVCNIGYITREWKREEWIKHSGTLSHKVTEENCLKEWEKKNDVTARRWLWFQVTHGDQHWSKTPERVWFV